LPHMQIQYSKNCEEHFDMNLFCRTIADEILSSGLYPCGGLRVRATAQDHVVIADAHPHNKFIDMVFRIGKGRSDTDKKKTGGAKKRVGPFKPPRKSSWVSFLLTGTLCCR